MLAHTHRYIFLLEFLLFVGKNLNDQSWNGKKYPPSWHPPPADEEPPNNTVMLILEFRFSCNLDIHIFASTIRAFHFDNLLYYLFFRNMIRSIIFFAVSTPQYAIIIPHALLPAAIVTATTAAMMMSANMSAWERSLYLFMHPPFPPNRGLVRISRSSLIRIA